LILEKLTTIPFHSTKTPTSNPKTALSLFYWFPPSITPKINEIQVISSPNQHHLGFPRSKPF